MSTRCCSRANCGRRSMCAIPRISRTRSESAARCRATATPRTRCTCAFNCSTWKRRAAPRSTSCTSGLRPHAVGPTSVRQGGTELPAHAPTGSPRTRCADFVHLPVAPRTAKSSTKSPAHLGRHKGVADATRGYSAGECTIGCDSAERRSSHRLGLAALTAWPRSRSATAKRAAEAALLEDHVDRLARPTLAASKRSSARRSSGVAAR